MTEEIQGVPAEPDDHHGGEIHMPPNSYWPLVASFGTAGLLLGLVTLNNNPLIIVVGAIILVIGVGGWIKDARTEYNELH
ncbi:MAG TPA: cytochrome c oxidase subunit 4 [Candidatus Dormibacteraeota bacterium]|nr:cytochrome c oxidase subunit 4 [Candidatus Dormibacteraeota bacterium]